MSNLPESPAPTEYGDCPACAGSSVLGEKRGVRCSTCNGAARILVPATAPAGDTDLDALRALCDAASKSSSRTLRQDDIDFRNAFTPAVVRRLLDTIAGLRVRVAELDQASDLAIKMMNEAESEAERASVAKSAPAGGSIDSAEFRALLCRVFGVKNLIYSDALPALLAHIDAYADRARTPQAAPAAVPEGWKLVPIDPTGEMTHAVLRANRGEKGWQSIKVTQELGIARAVYATMLKAAPTPPAQPAPDLSAALAEWERLKDPVVLHASLLKGLPAQLTPEQLRHIAGDYSGAPDLSGSTGMRAFVDEVIGAAFGGSGLDGDVIQELGVKHGLLAPTEMKEACGEACQCAEVCGEWPVTCYRKTYQGAASERDAALEEAAALIDANQETHIINGANGESNLRTISPRRANNLMGTSYSAAIRALLSTPPTTGATS